MYQTGKVEHNDQSIPIPVSIYLTKDWKETFMVIRYKSDDPKPPQRAQAIFRRRFDVEISM